MLIFKLVRQFLLTAMALICVKVVVGQEVSGVVTDAMTNEPIPFANVWIKGTTQGICTDINGTFKLKVSPNNTLYVSSIGYLKDSIELHDEVAGLTCQLTPDLISIDEIIVTPDLSYDEAMFKKVLSHKKENIKLLNSIKDFDNYDRTSVLLATDKSSKLQNMLNIPEDVVIKDTSENRYLPVYFSESVKNVSEENDSDDQLITTKKDGVFPNLNEQIEIMILKKIAVDFNFYKNQIIVFDRGFISPLSNVALMYYNIYLSDSIVVDDNKQYKFSFYPRNKRGLLFKGHFWVEDTSFALTRIEATIAEKANLNFIDDLHVEIEFEKQPNGSWFYKDQKMGVIFTFGKKTSLSIEDNQYHNLDKGGKFHINRSQQFVVPELLDLEVKELSSDYPFMNNYSEIEVQTKEGIKTLKENKVIKGVDQVGEMFLSGYYTRGILEVGPVFDLYSNNRVEGNRFTLPLRTGEALFKNYTIGGYLGYGTRSEKFKFGLSTAYRLPVKKRTILSAQYSDDYILAAKNQYIQFIQENPYNKGNGNFISALTSKYSNAYVFGQNHFEFKFETDLVKGIGLTVSPYYNRNYSSEFIKFNVEGEDIGKFDNRGVLVNFRFSFTQDFDEVYFARVYYGNHQPVINASFDVGQIDNLGAYHGSVTNTNDYYILSNVSVKHRFSFGQAYIRYMVSAGYMVGDVPFTLLEKPYGTNSLGYSRYSFNLLDYSSFSNNLYTNIHLNLNGGGVIFNRIPLISSLNLREMVSFKCHYGTQTDHLRNTIDIPEFFNHKQTMPHMELGLGITNIFKVLRVEYIQLLSNTESTRQYSISHGIGMRFEAMF